MLVATVYTKSGDIAATFFTKNRQTMREYYLKMAPVRPEWDRVRFGRSIYTPAQIYSGNKGEITQC